MKTRLLLTFGFIALISLFSCEKDSSTIANNYSNDIDQISLSSFNKNHYLKDQENSYLELLSKSLAKALEKKDIRDIIKKEALKMFDGDYDVLYNTIRDFKVEGKSINELLKDEFFRFSSESDKMAMLTNNKRLQFSVPVNCDKWNTSKIRPLVAFIPNNFDEKLYTAVKAFDSNLNEVWLSTKTEPNVPVIVIGYCERVDDNGILLNKSKETFDYPISPMSSNIPYVIKDDFAPKGSMAIPTTPTDLKSYAYLPFTIDLTWIDNSYDETNFKVEQRISPNNFVEIATLPANQNYFSVISNLYLNTKYSFRVRAINSSGSSNYSNIVYDYASSRRESNWEYIYQMKFTNLSAVESWVSGAPEIRWIAFNGSTQVGEVNYFEPSRRNQIDNVWYTYNYKIFRWYLDSYGKVCTYQWIERDFPTGDIITINIPFWSRNDSGDLENFGSLSITLREKDDIIGSSPVDWRNPLSDIFTAGGIFQFKMKNLEY